MRSRRRTGRPAAPGFTLIEVVVALAILAISLTALLTTQAASLRNASKVRDLTIATLLARSKMVDIEQELFDEGFTTGDQEDSGDFSDEGYREFKWEAKVSEVEITLDTLGHLCEGFEEETDYDDSGEGGCGDMLAGFGGPLEGTMDEIGNSMRFVELTITWPIGLDGKYSDSMSVSALITREDFGLEQADMLRDALDAGNALRGGATGGGRSSGGGNNPLSRGGAK